MTYFWIALVALIVAFFAVIIVRALRFTPKTTAVVEPQRWRSTNRRQFRTLPK